MSNKCGNYPAFGNLTVGYCTFGNVFHFAVTGHDRLAVTFHVRFVGHIL